MSDDNARLPQGLILGGRWLQRAPSGRSTRRISSAKGDSPPATISQLGNGGSPLVSEAGWLVLTHGVGAGPHCCIGAALLDRRIRSGPCARLRQPLWHGDHFRLPYAVSGRAT